MGMSNSVWKAVSRSGDFARAFLTLRPRPNERWMGTCCLGFRFALLLFTFLAYFLAFFFLCLKFKDFKLSFQGDLSFLLLDHYEAFWELLLRCCCLCQSKSRVKLSGLGHPASDYKEGLSSTSFQPKASRRRKVSDEAKQ